MSPNPASPKISLDRGGVEGVDVDLGLHRVAVVGIGAAVVVAGAGADRPPPERSGRNGRALGPGRDPVAVGGRLAAEDQRPAGLEHPQELGGGDLEIGDVVEDSVAEHQVEGVVWERELLGVGDDGVDVEAEGLGVGARARRASPGRCRWR